MCLRKYWAGLSDEKLSYTNHEAGEEAMSHFFTKFDRPLCRDSFIVFCDFELLGASLCIP